MVLRFRSNAGARRRACQRLGYCACTSLSSRWSCHRRAGSLRAGADRTRTTPAGDRPPNGAPSCCGDASRESSPRAADRDAARALAAARSPPRSVGVLRTQAVEPLLRLGCELDLPRGHRHPSRVTSPPVTEQDAFVPSLTNHSPGPCTTRQITSQPPPLGHISIGEDAYVAEVVEGREVCCVLQRGPRASAATFVRLWHERGRRAREPAAPPPPTAREPAARRPAPPANRFSFRRVPSTDRRRSAIRSRCTRPSQGRPSRRGCCPR